MPLSVITTAQEQLVSTPVEEALREGIERVGSAVLLVPSFAQALDVQRTLAALPGLALSVTTTTPGAWVKERWEVWGDGRSIAGDTELMVLVRAAMKAIPPEELAPIELSLGVVNVVSSLVGSALPWLPLDERGVVQAEVCAACGLTAAETKLVGVAGVVASLLAERGYVGAAEASVLAVRQLAQAGVATPPVVVAGFGTMGRADRELLCALAETSQVTAVIQTCTGPASQLAREFAAWLGARGAQVGESPAPGATVGRCDELGHLLDALFTDTTLDPTASEAVDLLLPAGPVAVSELVAERVEHLMHDGAKQVVVVTSNVAAARRTLVPKLIARGLPVRLSWSTALLDCPACQAFFAYARTVAQLVDLAATWPEPAMGLEGPVAQLGDMSWWPPSELSDFLMSDIAHVGAERAWWADATWRGNRLLTPSRLLELLQSERDTSAPVARATVELLRGRMGTAASKLLQPYVESMERGEAPRDEQASEARAVLQAILQLAGTLRELGVTCDPAVPGAVSLSELVEVAEWAANGMGVMTRTGNAEAEHMVAIMGPGAASRLAPGSVDALIACGHTGVEQPISSRDDLTNALLELLGVEEHVDPMAEARASFHALVAAPRTHLTLERTLYDVDSKPTYPSVVLSELLSAYGIPASASYPDITLPKATRSEARLAGNLAPTGRAPVARPVGDPAPAGRLTHASRSCIFVPQDGRDGLPGGKPVLSASQIETYLDCPYKWFSLRRLRLGTVDAGHGGMEMGTFAHRVLEVTHRELLARALEAQNPGVDREELLARIEANPVCHVPGSRVTPETLDAARASLELEFDLHQQHMYMIKRPRPGQQLLVAHNFAERAQESQLRDDLLSSLAFQTQILQGFEPRLFEWGFGRHDQLVEYAGAYFTGTVDRIDVSPHGTAVIIDYKHKSPNGFAAEYDALQEGVLEGDRLPNRVQSLIYGQVVRRAFEGRLRLVGSVYLSTKSPHALAGVADANVADLVFGSMSSKRVERVSVPRAADGTSGMDALLDRTEELVAEQVSQMLAGNVEARPRDAHSCDYCPVMQCERRVAR